jgi:hypothetical protein
MEQAPKTSRRVEPRRRLDEAARQLRAARDALDKARAEYAKARDEFIAAREPVEAADHARLLAATDTSRDPIWRPRTLADQVLDVLPATQAEIIERTGIRRETVSTVIARLKKAGGIRPQGKRRTKGDAGRMVTVYAEVTGYRSDAGLDNVQVALSPLTTLDAESPAPTTLSLLATTLAQYWVAGTPPAGGSGSSSPLDPSLNWNPPTDDAD